jgi:hypothetical protein
MKTTSISYSLQAFIMLPLEVRGRESMALLDRKTEATPGVECPLLSVSIDYAPVTPKLKPATGFRAKRP